jgi:hypothetical protein
MEEQQSIAPTTTVQQDMTTAGQRKVNLIWEYTQASIAILVTMALIYTAIKQITAPEVRNAFFLIVGFYFARTNHQAIGGIGPKPTQMYEGR